MVHVKFELRLFSLDELSEKAREKAIEEHRRFMLDTMTPEDYISGDPEYDTPEALRECYESEYNYIWSCDDPVVESIEINEYLFFENGELANVCKYYGGPKRGKTILNFMGRDIEI